MVNAEYCTIAAEIDNSLNTYYIIKVGHTTDSVVKRANTQRLKVIWAHKKPSMSWSWTTGAREDCEKEILSIGRLMFGRTNVDYSAGGHTEMVGKFATAHEANEAAWELLDAVKKDPRFSGDKYWVHPKATRPWWHLAAKAA